MDEINKYINKNVTNLLKEFVDKKRNNKKVFFYPGKVVDNKDPNQLGRCRIRVYSVYGSTIPDEDLPWAIPDFSFIGSTLGSFIVPSIDTIVNVYFEDDEFYQPKYSTKVLHDSKLLNFSSDIYEDYPDSMVFFETENGDYFKINRATNVVTFHTASGDLVRIEANGDITVDTTGSERGNITLKSSNNISIEAGKELTLKAGTKMNMEFPTASLWYPNTLPADSFTGKPQGVAGGVTGLSLSEPT